MGLPYLPMLNSSTPRRASSVSLASTLSAHTATSARLLFRWSTAASCMRSKRGPRSITPLPERSALREPRATVSPAQPRSLAERSCLPGGECDEEGRSFRAELYDPATRTFVATGNMTFSRVWHTLTLLPDGTVLAAGGETDKCSTGDPCLFGSVASAELYDPSTGVFAATGGMTAPRETHTATLLKDGRVLIAGGVSYGGIGMFLGSTASAELYPPPVLVPPPSLLSVAGDGEGQGAIQHAGTYQLVSSGTPAVAGEVLVLYVTGLADGGLIPPQVAIGGRIAEVLWFGNTPGFAGLNQINFRVPGAAAPGSAVPVRLNYLGRPSNEVTIGVR